MALTNGISSEGGVCRSTGKTRSCCVDGDDSEQVLGALNESTHHKGLAHAHGTDGVAADTHPAFPCCLFSLQPVAGDGSATIVLRLLPVNGHGVQSDVADGRLLTLTRDSCSRTDGKDYRLEDSDIHRVSIQLQFTV